MIELALLGSPRHAPAQESKRSFYVGPSGSDRTGDGSVRNPWASLAHATDVMPDVGAELVFLDGSYGPQSLSRAFRKPVIIRAQRPFRARWTSTPTHHRVLHVQGAQRITLSGFEMSGGRGATMTT